MRGLAAATVLALAAGPAAALTCTPWTPVDAYLTAAESGSSFVVVQGILRFDEKRLPRVKMRRQGEVPPRTAIPARMTGKKMTAEGFKRPFSADVTLEVLCYGPWCASAVNGGDYLGFLEQREGGYVLSVNPCGGYGFALNSRKVQRQILACHRGGACTPSLPR